jgi:hypothetical protein
LGASSRRGCPSPGLRHFDSSFLVLPFASAYFLRLRRCAAHVAFCVLGRLVSRNYFMGIWTKSGFRFCSLRNVRFVGAKKKPARRSGLEPLSMESQGRDSFIVARLGLLANQVFLVCIFWFLLWWAYRDVCSVAVSPAEGSVSRRRHRNDQGMPLADPKRLLEQPGRCLPCDPRYLAQFEK